MATWGYKSESIFIEPNIKMAKFMAQITYPPQNYFLV